jgi:hypothetical protein
VSGGIDPLVLNLGKTRRLGFDPGSLHVGFVVDKVELGQVFPPENFGFPCQFHSTGAPLLGKTKKKRIFLFIFITVLHNKPQGCGASLASAAGPFYKNKIIKKPRHWMEASGQLHTPTALTPVPTKQGTGWAPVTVWTFRRRVIFLSPVSIRTSRLPPLDLK